MTFVVDLAIHFSYLSIYPARLQQIQPESENSYLNFLVLVSATIISTGIGELDVLVSATIISTGIGELDVTGSNVGGSPVVAHCHWLSLPGFCPHSKQVLFFFLFIMMRSSIGGVAYVTVF